MTSYYALRTFTPTPNLITIEEVMARAGCHGMDRKKFMQSSRRTGLPRVRINKRVIRYDPLAVEAWIRRRSC